MIALIIICGAFAKPAVEAALPILGFSDPVASLVGKRWGRRRLFRDKSYAGTLAFFGAGLVTVGILLVLSRPELGMPRIFTVSVCLSAVGAVTELFSSRIDDNFSIPVVCAAVGALLL